MRFLKKMNIQTGNDGEIIIFNEMKTPLGASSERLVSESLSCSFKRLIHQKLLFIHGITKL